jgi:hypothetical protein
MIWPNVKIKAIAWRVVGIVYHNTLILSSCHHVSARFGKKNTEIYTWFSVFYLSNCEIYHVKILK